MKQFKFLTIGLILLLGFVSCEKPREDFQLSETEITVSAGDVYLLTGTGDNVYIATSDNEWIATVEYVDVPIVKGIHPGVTKIQINDRFCTVTVTGVYDEVCYEPYFDWGSSKSTVKDYMTKGGLAYSADMSLYDSANQLYYETYYDKNDKYKADFYVYIFDSHDKLLQSQVFIGNRLLIEDFLKERYVDQNYENSSEGILAFYTTHNEYNEQTNIIWMDAYQVGEPWATKFPKKYWSLVYYPAD